MRNRIFVYLILFNVVFVACGNNTRQEAFDQISNASVALPTTANEPAAATSLSILFPNESVEKGQSICLDVKVADFIQMLSMQYTIQWDPTVLKFVKTDGFKLPYLSKESFGAHATARGVLTFLWIDNTLTGINIPDGDSIFQLCFEAIGSKGSSSKIAIVGTPTPMEAVNSKEQILSIKGTEGSVVVK